MILATSKQDLRARARRRLYPIHMYCGRNGSGKSICAAWDTLLTLEAGRPVLSTMRFLDYNNPRPCDGYETTVEEWTEVETDDGESYLPVFGRQRCTSSKHGRRSHLQAHPLYVPFTSFQQLLDWRFGDVVMDEVTGVANSKDSQSLPAPVSNFIGQMCREDVAVRITGISWMRAAKELREVVNAVTRCRSILPVRKTSGMSVEERIWRPRRLALWKTYAADTLPLDDITDNAWKEATLLAKGRHWIPDSPARLSYRTYDKVLSVGQITDAGTCAVCSGRRVRQECTCADYADRKARVASPRRRSSTVA